MIIECRMPLPDTLKALDIYDIFRFEDAVDSNVIPAVTPDRMPIPETTENFNDSTRGKKIRELCCEFNCVIK